MATIIYDALVWLVLATLFDDVQQYLARLSPSECPLQLPQLGCRTQIRVLVHGYRPSWLVVPSAKSI